jgi:hypothetical protein
MTTSALEELEEKYSEIVGMMPDIFDSHNFILALAQRYQQLYVHALSEYAGNNQPFLTVHGEIAKRLKKRVDLVKHIDNRTSKNIFRLDSDAAVWEKVKK